MTHFLPRSALRPLPQDPLLPQLPLALDAPAMAGVLARWARARSPGIQIQACQVVQIKYRPRRNLSVAYRLQLDDAGHGPREQLVSTRWCHGGDAARRHAKALAAATAAVDAPLSVTHDAGLDVLAHWWPHDPRLGPAAVALQRLQAHDVHDVARALHPGSTPHEPPQVRLAHVVPERRLTAHVQWTGADGRRHAVYAKADAQGRGASTQALLQQLHQSAAQRRGDLRTPRPLGWQPGCGLHWQTALPGQSLGERDHHLDVATAARAGALLAALHASPVSAAAPLSLQALHQAPQDVAAVVALAAPAHAEAAQALALALQPGVSELSVAPQALLHGDLHPGNVLLADDGTLGLVDLDSACIGPLPLDLGAWIADGATRAVVDGTDPGHTLAVARAFAEAHALAWGHRLAESRLAWAVAYQLLCQRVLRGAVNLKPGRYESLGPLLDLAHRLLQRGHLDALANPVVDPAGHPSQPQVTT